MIKKFLCGCLATICIAIAGYGMQSITENPLINEQLFIQEIIQTQKSTQQPQLQMQEQIQIQTETQIPTGNLVINKSLISGVWHVGCDVMGNQAWVKDQISNPQGIKSKEGHRLAYCGDPSHWIIYLDQHGTPFYMDEIKSGATGGTLHTKFYTDGTYTEEKNIADIKIGQRIYWTTWHESQVWHHTGITTPEIPTFIFVINNIEYQIKPNEVFMLQNLPAGTYQIIEKYDPNYFIADVSIPFVLQDDCDVKASVQINEDQTTSVNFVNQRIIPDNIVPQTQAPTQLITEEPTEYITQKPTQKITELITEKQTEKVTQAITQKHTEKQTEKVTQIVTQKYTEKQTESITQAVTEKKTEKVTQPVTEKKTEKITQKQTEKKTEQQTQKQTTNPKESLPYLYGDFTNNETQTQKITEQTTQKQKQKEKPIVVFETTNINKPNNETIINRTVPTQEIEGTYQQTLKEAPKTGDDTNIIFWICLSAIVLIVLLIDVCIIFSKRKK